MTYYQSVHRYSCFAKLCRFSFKKLVQSNSNTSHFMDSRNNGPTQKKNWTWLLITPRYKTNDEKVPWCTSKQNRMLPLSSCICKSFIRQVFSRTRKQNINRQSSGNSDSEVWAFWVKRHFFKHHLSNLFQCMMFLQLVGSFVFL